MYTHNLSTTVLPYCSRSTSLPLLSFPRYLDVFVQHLRVRDFVPLFRFLNVDVTEADIKAMLSLISGTDDG